MSVFQAEVDDSAADESGQVRVRVEGRRQDSGQNIQDGHGLRFAHQRQIDEFLDLASSEQRSHSFVFLARFLFSRMGRQLDTQTMQKTQTHVDRAVVLVEARVQFDAASRRQPLVREVSPRARQASSGAPLRLPVRRSGTRIPPRCNSSAKLRSGRRSHPSSRQKRRASDEIVQR